MRQYDNIYLKLLAVLFARETKLVRPWGLTYNRLTYNTKRLAEIALLATLFSSARLPRRTNLKAHENHKRHWFLFQESF